MEEIVKINSERKTITKTHHKPIDVPVIIHYLGHITVFEPPSHGNYKSSKKEKSNLSGHTRTVPLVLEEIEFQVSNTIFNSHEI